MLSSAQITEHGRELSDQSLILKPLHYLLEESGKHKNFGYIIPGIWILRHGHNILKNVTIKIKKGRNKSLASRIIHIISKLCVWFVHSKCIATSNMFMYVTTTICVGDGQKVLQYRKWVIKFVKMKIKFTIIR